MKIAHDLIRATLVVCSCCVLIDTAIAQSSREKKRDEDPPNAKELELRLEKAETALVDEYKEVAIEFYKQGDKEKVDGHAPPSEAPESHAAGVGKPYC